jgi:hypothetical protein
MEFNELWGNIGNFTVKAAKTVSGVQAYQDRKEAKLLKEEANDIYQETIQENEKRRENANDALTAFGKLRLESLQDTVGVFLKYLTIMQYQFRDKEYDLAGKIDLKSEEVKQLESIDLSAQEAFKTTAAAGGLAAAAVAGVPSLVTGTVSAVATASTGTAISSLSGAAATNATLAWLGGGSLASGGLGVAGGQAILTAITGASAGLVALAATGIVAGMYYSKKLTAAETFYSNVIDFRESAKCGWALMDGIIERAKELQNVTQNLRERIHHQLALLEPLIYDFVNDDIYYVETFQQTALLVKTMSELSQIPVLDENGDISESSRIEITKVNKILNREL